MGKAIQPGAGMSMDQTQTPFAEASANLGAWLRGKPDTLWRRPDPTARLAEAEGCDPAGIAPLLGARLRSARRTSVLEHVGFFANLLGGLGAGVVAWEAWDRLAHPWALAAFAAAGAVGTVHFGVQVRGRRLRRERDLGSGAPHPDEARPEAIALTPGRVAAAGATGKPRDLAMEHLQAVEILDRGEGDHLVRFLARGKEGPVPFATATRVPEAAARALVLALRARGVRFEGDAARFAAEIESRTVVLEPEAASAGLAAVTAGRYRNLAEAASLALAREAAAA